MSLPKPQPSAIDAAMTVVSTVGPALPASPTMAARIGDALGIDKAFTLARLAALHENLHALDDHIRTQVRSVFPDETSIVHGVSRLARAAKGKGSTAGDSDRVLAAGREAYLMGAALSTNPYAREHVAFPVWEAGWTMAHIEGDLEAAQSALMDSPGLVRALDVVRAHGFDVSRPGFRGERGAA